MRWGFRGSSRQHPREAAQHPRRDQEQQDAKAKSKTVFSSFSPLAWLSKLTARNSAAKPPEQATPVPAKSRAQPAASFSPHFHKPAAANTSPASASQSSPSRSGSSSSSAAAASGGTAPRRVDAGADATAADIAPRRRSVGNDETESDAAAARRHLCRRRHYSVGGDMDNLRPLGHHLISLSRSASPKPAPVRTLPPTPLPPLLSESNTDEEESKRPPRSRRRRPRRAATAGRRSFSSHGNGKHGPPGVAVRVRSPRVSELERFAVVRRTRDPQREFRASMVEMIASKRMVGRPQELETLLACYLSLNADEHHDCIVKVFRQVWFDLKNNNSAAPAAAS